jgi:hypothetical protein
MEDAGAQIKFAGDWWSVRQSMEQSPDKREEAQRLAAGWLDEASALVKGTSPLLTNPDDRLTARRLAMLYPFSSTAGRVVRVTSWICFGVTVTSLGASFSQRQIHDRPGWVTYDLAAGALFATLGLILRFVAVAVENVASSMPPEDPRHGVVSRFLLLYRLRRNSARWVRLLFYSGLLGLVAYIGNAIRVALDRQDLVTVPLSVAGTIVYGLALLGIRTWAVSLDSASDPGHPMTAASALPRATAAPPTTPSGPGGPLRANDGTPSPGGRPISGTNASRRGQP